MEARIPAELKFEGNVAENFKRFKQNVEIYLQATGKQSKPDEVKVAIFLNLIGEEGVEIFNTLALTEEDRKNYSKVVKEFENYTSPQKNIVYERFKFFTRKQEVAESFDHFLTDLKKLAASCEFEGQKDGLIRDRIVLGINDKALQEKLLAKQNLDLSRAEAECRSWELTKCQVKNVQEEQVLEIGRWSRKNFKARQPQSVQRQWQKSEDNKNESSTSKFLCFRCKSWHRARECKAFGQKCRRCGLLNHFEKACSVRGIKEVARQEDETRDDDEDSVLGEEFSLSINSITTVNSHAVNLIQRCYEIIKINNIPVKCKLDSGADVNIMPLNIYEKYFSNVKLSKTKMVLKTFGNFVVKPVGCAMLECNINKKCYNVQFVIVEVVSDVLVGYETCMVTGLLRTVNVVQEIDERSKFIKENIECFTGLGKFEEKCNIKLKSNAEPVARPPRRVPLGIKDKLKKKLDELESMNIISRVKSPGEWVSNLVIIEKTNKSLRLCLDPQDLNKAIQRDYYQIPTLDEISAKLAGQSFFTVLDLKDGYYQIQLDEESSKLCTFSTVFGCYKFNRLPFGISNAPEHFQNVIEKAFGDIPNVIVYFDDILIATKDEKQHDQILKQVMDRSKLLNVKFNNQKLQYKTNNVKYLGQVFCKEGMKPDEDRVKALLNLKNPENVKELQKILGMINYLRRFVDNFAEKTSKLRELLKKNVEFQWLPEHTKVLNKIKTLLSKEPILGNFDKNKEITIQSDASQNGLGCTLMQENKPICYASRSLTETEKAYSQIEKELLGIVFATNKFHYYCYGRPVTVITDHKPLLSIIRKPIAVVGSPRLQRMKIKLLKYDIKLQFSPGKELHIADLLSRDYIKDKVEDDKELTEVVHSVEKHLDISDEKREQFVIETLKDTDLQILLKFCKEGWPKSIKKLPIPLRVYWPLQSAIFAENNLLFLNDRLIVPKNLVGNMLKILHEYHMGITKTRLRAKCNLYWPSMDKDIKQMVSNCRICEKYRPKNCKEPMIPHQIPDKPFLKVATDIFDYGGKSFMVLADYFTGWIEVVEMRSKTGHEVVEKLKKIFSTHGIPQEVVSDNMPYNSFAVNQFAKEWGFKINTSSPHYPKSNGLAEKSVGIAKGLLRKSADLEYSLLEYRNTPVLSTGLTPSQMLMGRMLRSKLPIVSDKLRPKYFDNDKIKEKIELKRYLDKTYYDRSAKKREEFDEGENVVIRGKNKEWMPGRVESKCDSPRSYIVRDTNNQVVRRNSSFLKKTGQEPIFKNVDSDWDNSTIDCSKPAPNRLESRELSKRSIRPPVRFKDYEMY